MEFNAWCYLPIIYYFPQKVCNFHCLYLGKNYCFKESLLLVFKCLNFNYFMLQSQKIKCLVLSRYLHSDPREGNWREAFPFPSSPLRVCLARSLARSLAHTWHSRSRDNPERLQVVSAPYYHFHHYFIPSSSPLDRSLGRLYKSPFWLVPLVWREDGQVQSSWENRRHERSL